MKKKLTVFAVSNRISVLRRGKLVANKFAKESSAEEVTALIAEALETAWKQLLKFFLWK